MGDEQQAGYEPPPAFAPPTLRGAPINEYQVLGRSSYPAGLQSPQSAQWAGYYARTGFRPPAMQPYGPQPYGPQPYGPQQYTPQSPVPWHPALGAAATRPARLSRRVSLLVAATVVAALIAVITLLSVAKNPSRQTHSLSLPQSAGGYSRVSTVAGSQLRSLAAGATFGAFPASDLAKAKAGLFSRGSGAPSLLFIGFDADESPTIGAQLRTTEPVTVVDQVFSGAGSTSQPVDLDPGPLGGALEVSDVDLDGQSATVGVWADQDTLGIVMEYSATGRPGISEMAAITLAMRDAAEN